MASSDRKRITAEGLLALFAGLSLAACDKSAPEAAPETATVPATQPPGAASQRVGAKEVAPAAPSASAQGAGEKTCAPGGCAPGACGGNTKK